MFTVKDLRDLLDSFDDSAFVSFYDLNDQQLDVCKDFTDDINLNFVVNVVSSGE